MKNCFVLSSCYMSSPVAALNEFIPFFIVHSLDFHQPSVTIYSLVIGLKYAYISSESNVTIFARHSKCQSCHLHYRMRMSRDPRFNLQSEYKTCVPNSATLFPVPPVGLLRCPSSTDATHQNSVSLTCLPNLILMLLFMCLLQSRLISRLSSAPCPHSHSC